MSRRAGAQLAHQIAGVDPHRAALGTQAGGGAGVDALVLVVALQGRGVLACALFRLDIAPHDDALARAQGQALGWAHRLAEAALDALVDDRVGGRQRLEVLQVDLRVVAEHHVRIENALRVEQALELPHQLVGIRAPFQFDEGRHVAPGAVFGLERAAELDRYQLCHVIHECRVAGDLQRVVEALGEDEVQVAFQGMAENDRLVVVVLVEQCEQAVDPFGQLFDREGDVLDDHRGAGLAHRADGGEGVLADLPQQVVHRRVFAEVDLFFQGELVDRCHDLRELLMQQALAGGARLDQQGAGTIRQALHPLRHARLVLDRTQAAPVQQLHGGYRLPLEQGHRTAAALDIGEHQ
ncbi:hypothetical protein D3C85_386370 [compost metagenome]